MKLKTTTCSKCGGTGKELDQAALGAELRKKREACDLSLRDMANAMQLSAPYLSDLERGNRHWSPELIAKFEAALQ